MLDHEDRPRTQWLHWSRCIADASILSLLVDPALAACPLRRPRARGQEKALDGEGHGCGLAGPAPIPRSSTRCCARGSGRVDGSEPEKTRRVLFVVSDPGPLLRSTTASCAERRAVFT
jgi:hypothetical protein